MPGDIAERLRASERDEVEQRLEGAAQQLRDAGIEKVSTLVGSGKPGPEIVKAAADEGCDVIVMSTHGRTGLQRAMLGSVANYVVHNVENAAVLLVRPSG